MNAAARERFDRVLDDVLAEMPALIHELLDRVPLHVEDHPSAEMMHSLGVRYREQLCGLYTGVPLTERSVEQSGRLPDVVTIYREGILAAARAARSRILQGNLHEQIRITLLHELGHHHGLDEDDLADLGYS